MQGRQARGRLLSGPRGAILILVVLSLLWGGLAQAQCTSTPFGSNPCAAPKKFLAPPGSGSALAPPMGLGQLILWDDFKTFDPSWGRAGPTRYVAAGRLELHAPAG